MKTSSIRIAAALAMAVLPAAAIAQKPIAAAMDVAFQYVNSTVKVAEVRPGGTGDSLGIRPGDVIVKAGGKPITSEGRLMAFIRSMKVGNPITVTVKRQGKEVELSGTAMAPQ